MYLACRSTLIVSLLFGLVDRAAPILSTSSSKKSIMSAEPSKQVHDVPLRGKALRRNLFLFCSTLVDNRRTIILVIEPLSQSDRANSNSCFSD